MSPTVLRVGPYRFFFNSREERRRHVHVATADGNVKFWLEPTISIATFHNLRTKDLNAIEAMVREHADEFRQAWDTHFVQPGH